ncbi:MAG: hypothetical protein AB8H79_15765 [Myxococcota bacterium]
MADALETCIARDPTLLTWDDLGALDRRDFARTCSNDWDRTSGELTAYEQQEATAVCRDSRDRLAEIDVRSEEGCETVRALYRPE